MNKQRHIIKKQIIELNLSSQEGAFELQNQVSIIYNSKVIPLINNLLNHLIDADKVYRINSLEINLGNIEINSLEKELIDKILAQFQQQLEENIKLVNSKWSAQTQTNNNIHESSPHLHRTEMLSQVINGETRENIEDNKVILGTTADDYTPSHSKFSVESKPNINLHKSSPLVHRTEMFSNEMNGETGENIGKDKANSNLYYINSTQYQHPSDRIGISEITSKKALQLEIVSYFIQTGMLPWWAEKLSKQQLEEYCNYLITASPNQIKHIVEQSLKNEKQLQRIIYQFSDATLLKIIQFFAGESYPFIADYYSLLKEIFNQLENIINISDIKFRLEIWRGLFLNVCFRGDTNIEKIGLIQASLLHITTSLYVEYGKLLRIIIKNIKSLKIEKINSNSYLQKILEELINTSQNTLSNNIKEQEKSSTIESSEFSINNFIDLEDIYIYNAGLILLCPFLNRYLSKIGLIKDNGFVNTTSTERATLLLQYLVDASIELSEHILPLNKILCGIDLLEPMHTNLEITEQEQLESENLLSAIIQNWSILKNTSIEGLRKAFLQRKGILKVRDGSWLLQVERETYDVLLDKIPWNIRVVKLPWMNKILYVEW